MDNIGILYICTGDYVRFWEEFYRSMEKFFLPNSQKEYFIFTDAEEIYGENDSKLIHRIYQKNLGWPGNTLFRYKIFLKIEKQLKEMKYLFFFNANIICLKMVSEEEFLPKSQDLLVVQHPGYYNKEPYEFPYSRNRRSNAYISHMKGKIYICGGINGGKADAYLQMTKIINQKIELDYSRDIIAEWHDESYLNYYIFENNNYKLLQPDYCYPEGWDLPFDKKLLVLDKKNTIVLDNQKTAVQKQKMSKWKYRVNKIKKYIWKILWNIKYKVIGEKTK